LRQTVLQAVNFVPGRMCVKRPLGVARETIRGVNLPFATSIAAVSERRIANPERYLLRMLTL
jgi:hypothetical protein